MPSIPEEQEVALKRFRADILDAFADLEVEILAVQDALSEKRPISEARLNELREEARGSRKKFLERYARKISSPHESR